MARHDWKGRLVAHRPDSVERYRAAGLWGELTIAEELRASAERFGERPAVAAPDGLLTYAELDRGADRIAAGFAALGLRPGERILFQLANSTSAALAWYGALKAGLIPVCTLVAHRGREIDQILRRSGAVAHLVQADLPRADLVALGRRMARSHPALRELIAVGGGPDEGAVRFESLGTGVDGAAARATVDAIQRSIDPDEVAVFQLSGGTTSTPKIIPRLHAEYWYNAHAYARFWDWGSEERVAHLMPIVHNAGIVCGLHAPHAVGACALIGDPRREVAAPLLAQHGVTDMIVNLALFDLLTASPEMRRAVRGLKRLMFSGSKLPRAVVEEFEDDGCTVVQVFGMGEGLFMQTPVSASAAMRHHTVGVPLSAADEVRVAEPADGTPLAPGEVGELQCRGPYTLPGYFDAAERNRDAFTADGFYRTGDLVGERWIDGERCFAVEGRLKDVISRGGEKINVEEVERLLVEHPRIRLAAVVAMPDPRLGERACAFAVLEAGDEEAFELDELTGYLDANEVARFKWPERLEVVADLPRTNVGKIDKRALRRDIAAKSEWLVV